MGSFKKALDIIPSAFVSRSFGALADIQFPRPVQNCINNAFAKIAHLNMDEAEKNLSDYKSLSDLFTRSLKPGARSIALSDVVSPVDGKLSFIGKVDHGSFIEAKGQTYSADQLVGVPHSDLTNWLHDAYVFTIYLAPSNYHRIHAPISGQITDLAYTPGRLLPVNRLGYMLTDDLLPANERLTSFMNNDSGKKCALVKVGATCVGKISVTFDDFKANNSRIRSAFAKKLDQNVIVNAGDPIACFDLGSTVVLFVQADGFNPDPSLVPGNPISMGSALGSWT